MRKFLYGALSATLVLSPVTPIFASTTTTSTSATTNQAQVQEVAISLSDEGVLVDGKTASTQTNSAVYTSNDIIYYQDLDTYESGNKYGEGNEDERHTAEEAAKHTVINITKAGTYRISGNLSYGQIFVNVGKDEADKVTLILDNVDINCTVAPAVLFYNVYECDADATTETASNQVDTSEAGARVIIADDSINNITGSHVAKIYKDNADQKKQYKFDGAFYSRMSMEIDGETLGTGRLNITSDNEGLDTELHLTINGGIIHIQSKDDGINVNEDGISVLTVNGGYLSIFAGNGAEGDGIDSNGWITINGGTVISLSNPNSMDGGIDSDMGTTINGGTVIGAGTMYDAIEADSAQPFMFLQFNEDTDDLITVIDEDNNPVFAYDFPHDYSYIVFSTPELTEGTYHVYKGGTIEGIEEDGFYSTITKYTKGTQLHHGGTSITTNKPPFGGQIPTGGSMPQMPADGNLPARPTDGKMPQRPTNSNIATDGAMTQKPMNIQFPTDGTMPTPPKGEFGGGRPGGMLTSSSETESYDFTLTASSTGFTNVSGSEITDTTTK